MGQGDSGALQLTDEQHRRFIEIIRQRRIVGNVTALREAGVTGHKRDIKKLLTDDLLEEAREARGWDIERVEDAVFKVASDPEHPSFQRTAQMVLRAYHPAYRDRSQVDVNHTGEVGNPDVAAALQRLNDLVAAAAVRASADTGQREVPRDALGRGESTPGVQVARLDRPSEPGTAAG